MDVEETCKGWVIDRITCDGKKQVVRKSHVYATKSHARWRRDHDESPS
jgi:hypothetical protein